MTHKKKQIQPRFQTPFNITSVTGEENNEPSETVQGDSYTVKELIEKHVNGIMPAVGLQPEYDHEEPSHDDDVTLRSPDLDLSDIDQITEKIKTVQTKLSTANEQRVESSNEKSEAVREKSEEPDH